MIKAVIFDMDGTILNTLDDLADAINYALGVRGHKNDFDNDIVRMFFGSGIRVAFERALALENGIEVEELEYIGTKEYEGKYKTDSDINSEIEKLLEIYVPYYNEHCNDKTAAYAGINELLNELKSMGIKIAVVSNKPDAAVTKLCEDLFAGLFDYHLGELPEIARKPERDMVDKSLQVLGVDRNEAIYVGDSEIDLLTAQNAQMNCVAVTWGFRGIEFLKAHNAEIIIQKPMELLDMISV